MTIARLSSLDRMFLHLESADWPGHFGGLAVVEGAALLDRTGRLRLPELQERVNRRLVQVPQLRRRLHFPGFLGGGPVWVDAHRFDIREHVHEGAVAAPGTDLQLLDAAARVYGRLLDRRRPLWELWLLTGLSDGRVGVLLKLHHSVADGMATMTMMGSLFDFEPDAVDPRSQNWVPEPVPAWWSLVADNFSNKRAAVQRLAGTLRVARQALGQTVAARTSLNQVVRTGRRVRFIGIDLEAMKKVAHAHEAKVNDVVLALWSGGLRELMLHRGEPTAGVELVVNMPISLRSAPNARAIDNEVGFVALALPVSDPDVVRRLDLIVPTTRKAKTEQQSGAIAEFLAAMSAIPFGKFFAAHQHSVNVRVTNVAGPPVPMYVLGARIIEILPITRLFGNVGLTLAAFSYAGRMSLVVTADSSAFPDLDVLMAGMERDWHTLAGTQVGAPVATPLRSLHVSNVE